MPTLIVFIVLSAIMTLFYWFKGWMTDAPYRKKWTFSKARIGLGAFLFFFGANRIFISSTTLTMIVCAIFMLYGIFIVYFSIKTYRFYTMKMIEEANQSQKQ
ncbi:ABC-type bacteriocin/lantibiotic exporter with double-glycine peptidase domain [Pullulanibacillus pueri]|uniref:YtpI-like protein n=1 Tax=Pullulanibacillus pueri TaxID=1437324 RepID=A0A8J2ZYE4_9BACL|nr:YtpI family protein [Pullulanibacillus pueri]MBM7683487.1 ABC-type bacteriocin/lantibiotic exporter with double-glycine peptidase domain [Pullulanibacillus pueri]GGH86720.1 hypothetical protein GCM10007096_35080 [Pullulanibacillus pueri]